MVEEVKLAADAIIKRELDYVFDLEPAVVHMSSGRKIDRKSALGAIERIRREVGALWNTRVPPTASATVELAHQPRIIERWRVIQRKVKADRPVRRLPEWASGLLFGLYAEQGWKAFDQAQNGKTVATGKWGDELFLLSNGVIACTEYPLGYPLNPEALSSTEARQQPC